MQTFPVIDPLGTEINFQYQEIVDGQKVWLEKDLILAGVYLEYYEDGPIAGYRPKYFFADHAQLYNRQKGFKVWLSEDDYKLLKSGKEI